MAVLVALFFVLIVFPIGITLWVSFVPYYDGVNAEALARFSLANFRTVIFETSFSSALSNTFILGIATATVVAAFTTLSAWLAVRRQPGAWLLDQLASAALVFPAIVLAVAFLQFVLNVPFALYGTLLSIIIASMVQFMPFGMRYSYAGVLQIHRELEEASAISGAGAVTTFLRIVVPLVAPAAVTCWLFVFLMVSKAVSIPLLLAGPKLAGGRGHHVRDVAERRRARTRRARHHLDDHHDGREHGLLHGLAPLRPLGALGEIFLQERRHLAVCGVERFIVDEVFLQARKTRADRLQLLQGLHLGIDRKILRVARARSGLPPTAHNRRTAWRHADASSLWES